MVTTHTQTHTHTHLITHLETNSSIKTSSCDLESTFPTSSDAEAANSPAQCEADLQNVILCVCVCVCECVCMRMRRNLRWQTVHYTLTPGCPFHSSLTCSFTLFLTHTHRHIRAQTLCLTVAAAADVNVSVCDQLSRYSHKAKS